MSFLLRLVMYGLVVVGVGLLVLPISTEAPTSAYAEYGVEGEGYREDGSAPVVPTRIAGGVMLVFAAVIIHRLYRSRRGDWLNVAATGTAALFDGLGLLTAAILCAGVPARIIERILGVQNPLHGMGDTELAMVAGVIGLLLGAPIMSLMASLLAPSWVKVDADGVSQQGMILRMRVAWQQLKKITVETNTLRGRDPQGNPTEYGSVDFQVLELESEKAVIAMRVPKTKTRSEIKKRLLEHVPEWHRQNLEDHLKEWR